MANNIETDIVYDIHDNKGNKIGRGILRSIGFCNTEARYSPKCFRMSYIIMEDGRKVESMKFDVESHTLKGKGSERSTDAHKSAYGAAGGRRKTRKERKAERKTRRRNCRR